ncbi:MAG: 23S rRNA (pseudouridine(1915)-N(3))-methyltransferase RlmH [Saprospiraceae bacterium]
MNIELICLGKNQFSFVEEAIDIYQKRLNHYCNFSVIYLDNIKISNKINPDIVKEKEAEKLIEKFSDNDFIILLDENGREFNSIEFADYIEKKMIYNDKKLKFVIGGAFGFSAKIKQRADALVSLSKMTFSHQIIRTIFMEQLYRAFTIIRNEKYHNN